MHPCIVRLVSCAYVCYRATDERGISMSARVVAMLCYDLRNVYTSHAHTATRANVKAAKQKKLKDLMKSTGTGR